MDNHTETRHINTKTKSEVSNMWHGSPHQNEASLKHTSSKYISKHTSMHNMLIY